MQFFCLLPAHHQRISIIKPDRLQPFYMKLAVKIITYIRINAILIIYNAI